MEEKWRGHLGSQVELLNPWSAGGPIRVPVTRTPSSTHCTQTHTDTPTHSHILILAGKQNIAVIITFGNKITQM